MSKAIHPERNCTVIIGGSGGAGSAVAKAFAESATPLAITYHSNLDSCQELAAELRESTKVTVHPVDLQQPHTIAALREAVLADHAGIQTLVYAAGPIFKWGAIGDLPSDDLESVLATETLGLHRCIAAFISDLRMTQGNIVACTTWANNRTMPGDSLSTIPKAGIESMMRHIAREEAIHGIRSNIVALGSFDMGMGSVDSPRNMVSSISQEEWQQMLAQIPLGNRLGRPEELAAAVVFLASDQASYITGQKLTVDGGLSL